MLRPVEVPLVAPDLESRAEALAILEGRYALPKVPDMPVARRILDIGAGVGGFAAWCHYLWPHAWADCYERDAVRAGYCKTNAPPGTLINVGAIEHKDIEAMPPAEVVRVAGGFGVVFVEAYKHPGAIKVLVLEWSTEAEYRDVAAFAFCLDLRLAHAAVDHLDRGCAVWLATEAEHEPGLDEHIVVGAEPLSAASGTEPTFALGIPHTPWVPERARSMRRLTHELGAAPLNLVEVRHFTEREPNHVWSARMWRWAVETKASHFVTLQDDARVAPNFWPALTAMVGAQPHDIIGLEATHPSIPYLAQRGERWCSTCAWIVGVAYVLPRDVLLALLAWRALQPAWRIIRTNEDTLVNDWCVETRRRVLHPIPTIVDHDLTIASTYDNDADTHRRPLVRWIDGDVEQLATREFWSVPRCTRLELPKEET